ncbi:hypothetical protein Bpfe_024535 [Biomphalaria pfeifferi]|uniref:Uncharacterized protein n=1 Tax=Biomphalaria pfeifferi TaxID=112525 RepID=A0AAD8B2C4_BIOPF|nr:hypothetical protein Bpfe_024535 [Biomphalaria pfeifferi]
MAAVCDTHGASIPHFQPRAGNWMARQIRLAHDNSKDIVPASAPRSRVGREEKFHSLYKVDFPLHPVEVFLEKFEEKEKPKRLTIRDVLFGNSPTAAFGDWKIPLRILKEASTNTKKRTTIPSLVEAKKEEVTERPPLQRQNSLPAIHISQPRRPSCLSEIKTPITSSAPPVRSKTVVAVTEKPASQNFAESKTEAKSGIEQILKTTLQPHVANLAADWLKQASLNDRQVIEKILRVQIKQNQLESAINKTVLPDIRKKVQLWLETATELERQIALKFFSSLAAVRNMSSTSEEPTNIKIQQVVNTLEKGKAKVCQTARSSKSPERESKLKYIKLLDQETRANRWMYATWHHLPEYRDDNPVNNWSSHFTKPGAGTPRHFVIHPDWG